MKKTLKINGQNQKVDFSIKTKSEEFTPQKKAKNGRSKLVNTEVTVEGYKPFEMCYEIYTTKRNGVSESYSVDGNVFASQKKAAEYAISIQK